MNKTQKRQRIANSISEIMDDSKRRSRVLGALTFDLLHSNAGYNVRFAFDFNVLRPFLFPLLDGAYGSASFYSTLFANSFFFNHGFSSLLLQPYMQELIASMKYFQESLKEHKSNAFSTASLDLPFARGLLLSWNESIYNPITRHKLASRLLEATTAGWDLFNRMYSKGVFLSVDELNLQGAMSSDYRRQEEYLNLRKVLHNAKRKRFSDDDDTRSAKHVDWLKSLERKRTDRDADAIYSIMNMNKLSITEGANEIVVLMTQDDIVKQVLTEHKDSWIQERRAQDDRIGSIVHDSSSRTVLWRDTDYLTMYMFLYDSDRSKFLLNIQKPFNLLERFLQSVLQFDVARLNEVHHATPVPSEIEEKAIDAYDSVKRHLKDFDKSLLIEKAALLRAPGIAEALETRKQLRDTSTSDFENFVKNISGMQRDMSVWFKESLTDLERVLQLLEVEMARFGLRFDKDSLKFYYPVKLSDDLPESFKRDAQTILTLLSAFDPQKTAQAVGILHDLRMRYPDVHETGVLWSRAYYVQGMPRMGLRVLRQTLRLPGASVNPEVLFTCSRNLKRVAELPEEQTAKLMDESLKMCLDANKFSEESDPRILRELSYLYWFKAKEIEQSRTTPVKRFYSTVEISSPIVPFSQESMEFVTKALRYSIEAQSRVSDSSIKYDQDPLWVMILNDTAYLRYSLNLGKILTLELSELEFAECRAEIVNHSKSEIMEALDKFRYLNKAQQETLTVANVLETAIRILLAEYDLGMIEDPRSKSDEELQSIVMEATVLTDRCRQISPKATCNEKLLLEITRRHAKLGEAQVSKGLSDLLANLSAD